MQRVVLSEAFAGLDRAEKLRRYRELWHGAGRYEILTDYPLHLDLELSGVCNLSCTNCFQSALDKKRLGLMDEGLFTSIIDEGATKGLCSIKLQIRGESFLHPKLFDLIAYAKERGVLDIQITTNGTLLDEAAIDRILASGLDGIVFSVDVRHEEACQRTMAKDRYARVPHHVTMLLEKRAARGQVRPWVRVKASTEDSSPEVMTALKTRLVGAFPLADIHIVGSVFDFRKDHDSFPGLRENYILRPCEYPMQRLAVFWDGQATVCCMDYHGDFGLPAASAVPVTEIWNSPKLASFREAHKAGKRVRMPICRHCHACVAPAAQEVFVDQSPRNKVDLELAEQV